MKNIYGIRVEKTDKFIPHHITIHRGVLGIFITFRTTQEFEDFLNVTGLTFEISDTKKSGSNGLFEYLTFSHNIIETTNFWKREDIPKEATKIKGYSNGSVVDCYFLKDDESLVIYRPNPNAKNVYQPLEIKEHIDYFKNNWLF